MVTLALGIAAINFVFDYNRTRADLEERAEAYAVSMATDVRWYVDVARQALNRAAEGLARTSDTDVSQVLSTALSELPAGVVIVVYDAEGNSRGSVGYASRLIHVGDRHYFRQLRDGRTWVISNLIADRLTGSKTFAVGLALRDGGMFNGAAVAYAPMDVFSQAWLGVGGKDSNAFLVHEEGWLSARLPPIDSDVYDHPLEASFVASFTGTPTGSYQAEASPIDGIARVLGFAKVESSPLIAVIGINPNEQIADVWRRVGATLAILAPILLLLGLVTLRMRSLILRQESTAHQLERSLARNEGLLLEIHHRVKNNLQSVLSLVRTQVKDPVGRAEIEPRIAAMVAVHEHIYRNDDFVEAPAPKYISEVASKVIYASGGNIRLQTDIADVALPSDIVMPIGQLVNEAIINAVKYGFPDGRQGVIDIRMTVDDGRTATLTIHDDGDPLPEKSSAGIGSRLIEAFAAQVRGTVETTSNAGGVTVTLRFPLGDRAE
ncbi:MAG TPA: histidine kinase dimerization/phosphoacceptor domain -containing protein [Devosia sp.]|nr:histidine kinase dimerization/phosphoacceptor domain -containing protein [Devosia sp.]